MRNRFGFIGEDDVYYPRRRRPRKGPAGGDDYDVVRCVVVRCFIEATFKHSKVPGAVRASKKRYPFLHPVISRGCRLLPKGAKAEGRRIRRGKLRKAKAEALKRGLVARSCAGSGSKDVVGEVKGIEMMGVLGAGRGARERGSRRLEVEGHSKR